MKRLTDITLVLMYLLILLHTVGNTFVLTGVSTVTPPALPMILFLIFLVIHIIQSLMKFFGSVAKVKKAAAAGQVCKMYPQFNKTTVIRRMSGLLVLVLALIHAIPVLPKLVDASLVSFHPLVLPAFQYLFYAMLVALAIHMASSVEQLLVRIGINPPKAIVRIIQAIIVILFIWVLVSIVTVLGGR